MVHDFQMKCISKLLRWFNDVPGEVARGTWEYDSFEPSEWRILSIHKWSLKSLIKTRSNWFENPHELSSKETEHYVVFQFLYLEWKAVGGKEIGLQAKAICS